MEEEVVEEEHWSLKLSGDKTRAMPPGNYGILCFLTGFLVITVFELF